MPTVAAEFTFSINGSLTFIGSTVSSFSVPTALSSSLTSKVKSCSTFGSLSGNPAIEPANWSALTTAGSREVNIPSDPPGCASFKEVLPDFSSVIFANMGFHTSWFFSITFLPGLISMSSFVFKTPCFKLPPRTPPTRFSGRVPGLFMSKLLAINT